MSSPLRARLTLWYVGAFSVVLILFSTGVYFFVERILVERMDANLRVTLRTARSALAHETNPSMLVGEAFLARSSPWSTLTDECWRESQFIPR
jgi:hypothetical protein